MATHNDTFCPKYRATVLPDENDNCSLCSAEIVPIYASSGYIKTKDEARELAIDWQQWASEESLSYSELIDWTDLFNRLGKRFGLMGEYRENGII
jgi:hypothetical protein